MASMRVADHIGRVLGGRYRLSAVIGTGASAHVFLAEDARLARRVAVKILHPALADDAAFLRRFRAEAHAAAGLSHPNVLAVYDWGEEDDGPFIVTEFLGGGSLRAMLDRGHRLTVSQALLVGLDAARGLDYAHRRGLVHRDIKPANLLFDEDGRLRIADFGLARALAEAAWTEPTGAVLGTARYAAPEQVRGTPLDGKADVYSLAVVLVEAVTGRVPFAADTTVGTILSRLERPLEVPDELGPMAPILARAGQPEPTGRPDAMAMGAAFHALAPKLPAPQPLPLAGPAMFDQAGGVVDSDPTEMGVAAVTGPKQGEPKAADRRDPTVPDLPKATHELKPAEVTRVIPEAAPIEPSPAGKSRRRWKRVVLAVVLALMCSAVATVAFVRAQVPTHPVPPVTGKVLLEARGELEPLGFRVVERREFNDAEPKDKVLRQTPATGKLKEGQTVTLLVSDGPHPVDIPELAGLSQQDATAVLEKAVLKLGDVTSEYSETVEAGVVIDWSPKGPAHHGDTVLLVVSRGPQPRTLPELTAMTYEQAARELQNLGLVPERDERYDNQVAAGKIIGTRPPVGNKVERGSRVTIVLSKGRPVVPNLNGMNQTQAKAALEAVSLRLGNVFGLGGTVFRSSPDAGTTVDVNTAVNIFIL